MAHWTSRELYTENQEGGLIIEKVYLVVVVIAKGVPEEEGPALCVLESNLGMRGAIP